MTSSRKTGGGDAKLPRKADLASTLRKAWYRLRLSVRHPARVPTWDSIVLTAASPEQAELYNWQLARAKRIGRIAGSTVTLAVPDPSGQRIGSGAATLNAIRALAEHYALNDGSDLHVENEVADHKGLSGSSEVRERSKNVVLSQNIVKLLAGKHILLIHAGGDSKRVPWANPMGKVFMPLPYLAADDPDGPVPLLFDHVLAIASCARQAFKGEGGLFIMTGDVLPCFDAFSMVLPEDASCIITVPITLGVASHHGVIVASKDGASNDKSFVSLVDNLLQKPSVEELVKSEAMLDDGRTLLDTGIIALRGTAWTELVRLACSSQSLISELLRNKKEMSLYEDLVAAWVPAKHDWLKGRPLGVELFNSLGKQRMWSYCAYDLRFLHFGTSSEVLDHFSGVNSGLLDHRHLCSLPASTVSDISSSSIILSSKIAARVSIGADSLVYDSTISGGIQIGSQCIVVSISVPECDASCNDSFRFILPDRHCLWEVPLAGCSDRVLVYCGLDDNPKTPFSKYGSFCEKRWSKVLEDLMINAIDLWEDTMDLNDKCLWNARIFPVISYFEMLKVASWFMSSSQDKDKKILTMWKNSSRVSLEELHSSIDFRKMCQGSTNHQAELSASIARACINHGLVGHNLSQLCDEIMQKEISGAETCRSFLALLPSLDEQNFNVIPRSRVLQVQVDLLRACKEESRAFELDPLVWEAVADETASAVRYGFKEDLSSTPHGSSATINHNNGLDQSIERQFSLKRVKVELPVRVDFVGGWSDTPPWSLERNGYVLNMSISLEGSLPIGTAIETSATNGILITDDAAQEEHIEDPTSVAAPFDGNDPFRLVKSALIITGVITSPILKSTGLQIKTWANVPRGSGLGTSSILAAAVVRGLLLITGGDASNENVARLVLVLEQLMGTGGGWQDQIGGLYPGIKLTTSLPGIPLRLQVCPLLASQELVTELQERLLVVFTGQVRLAHQVLQKVVTRYLRRDNLLISSIKRLVELANIGRECLMNGDIDELGEIMLEAWRLHQELDPFCSNELVDRLFELCDRYCCGYKLVGAGGGGFALLLAKDRDRANELRNMLIDSSEFDVKVYNWNIFVD